MEAREKGGVLDAIMVKSLIAAVVIGLLSSIIGSISAGETLTHSVLLPQESLEHFRNFNNGAIFLLFGQIVIDIAFSITGLLLLYLSDKTAIIRFLSMTVGVLQAAIIFLHLSLFWGPGWSRILDPYGDFSAPLALILLSFFQSFAFILAGIKR